ncbi:MAG: hypothetical protein KAX47_14535, partial [Zoogloea sp.]|nr:hypothetical protein [Zoogloea sp.]
LTLPGVEAGVHQPHNGGKNGRNEEPPDFGRCAVERLSQAPQEHEVAPGVVNVFGVYAQSGIG